MSETTNKPEKILVIKLGALGDVIIALGPFAAILNHHPDAHITLLTTQPFADIGRRCELFDAVEIDTRPKWNQPGEWLSLRKKLRQHHFTRVYDLQMNDRTGLYYQLFWPGPYPEWVGKIPGCSHYYDDASKNDIHAFVRHTELLALAGIEDIPLPDVRWMGGDISAFGLPEKVALLVPGCAPTRPEKRWPGASFIELGRILLERGLTPVIIGTASEGIVTNEIAAALPEAINLTGQTSLYDLAALGRAAMVAIGNDTGPMHLIAAAGAPSIGLFSGSSFPGRSAPIGPNVKTIQRDPISDLTVDDVVALLPEFS